MSKPWLVVTKSWFVAAGASIVKAFWAQPRTPDERFMVVALTAVALALMSVVLGSLSVGKAPAQ